MNAARNVPAVEMKFEDVENYMVEKAKKESLELAQDMESKQMKALNQKMSKMEELMRGQGMGYSFDFDDMINTDGEKLPDKFKMPQLQKFDGTGDPRIHLSQYTTIMSTTKALISIVARLFVLSLEGMAVNWYHGLEKSVRADWKELCSAFLKQYEYNTKLEVSIRDLELTKQKPNESFSDFLTRFMNKAGLMKNKLAEKDQVRMVVRNVSPNLVERL